ncbi:MAG: DNA alkylation repair protein [Candidatus Omnitrophota bacterium]|jgi:3-methyladenine DNA glycosylase AlkD
MGRLEEAKKQLRRGADKEKAKGLQRFFKTGPGEYAEGDIFLGLTAVLTRNTVKEFQDLALSDLIKLLHSKIHEERALALLIMVRQFDKADTGAKEKIYKAYLANTKFINNWDLVDLSAPQIVGGFLIDQDRSMLYKLAKSPWLWDRRIAILATFTFIRLGDFKDVFAISKLLLGDKEDLIHKACGWMLREAGKRNVQLEEEFLHKHCRIMPRTMLRYAIEKFPEKKRKFFLNAR